MICIDGCIDNCSNHNEKTILHESLYLIPQLGGRYSLNIEKMWIILSADFYFFLGKNVECFSNFEMCRFLFVDRNDFVFEKFNINLSIWFIPDILFMVVNGQTNWQIHR